MAYDSSKPVTGGALVAADIRENFRALKEDVIVDADKVDGIHASDIVGIDNFSNFKDLIVKNNATNPNYQLDINATTAILQTTTGLPYKASSVDLTVDITTSGANGLDTGTEAASTWYHLWAIYNGTTIAGLLSTSATAPTMPSGYTYKAYVGAIYNSASQNFIVIYQQGNRVRSASGSIGSLTATTATSLSLSVLIPSTAKFIWGSFFNSEGALLQIHPVTFTAGANSNAFASLRSNGYAYDQISCPIETAQTVYYAVSAGTGTLAAHGWEY